MVRSIRIRPVVGAALLTVALLPVRAFGQALPPVDDFLGVRILTAGASTPGGPVVLPNTADIERFGATEVGLAATNLSGGYDDSVLNPIRNFSAAPFTFAATGVTNANGTAGTLGAPATGHRVDADGNTVAGAGGTFTLTAAGTYAFTPGTDFADVAVGGKVRVAINYVVHGTNTAAGTTRDMPAVLILELTKTGATTFTQAPIGADFGTYGSSTRPSTDGKIFPDLQPFVGGMLRFAFSGNASSPLTVTNSGNVTTHGILNAYGISATTVGAHGWDGASATITDHSEDGGPGGMGGTVSVNNTGNIATSGIGAVGIFAYSTGGDGGKGGDSGYTRNAKAGGPAGTGGSVTVTGSGDISTGNFLPAFGVNAVGILAFSQGGNGGNGGDGSTFNGAENGANGGRGGTVLVDGTWNITTRGDKAYGIWGKSFGGKAGSGGDGGWTGTDSGNGGQGTEGGSVTINSGGTIRTSGDDAYGIFAQSIGGFGGDGGSGTGIFLASGGSGEKAGSGGTVSATNSGQIITTGVRSHGIFAESVGGGGGTGGSGSGLVGLGGSGAGGGNAGSVTVANTGSIDVRGDGARGIYAQSVGGGGGDGGNGAGLVGVGGSGSATSDGGVVKVANSGSITSGSNAIFAQSVGGGGGDGGGSVGLISIGGSGGAGGNAKSVSVSSHGNLTTLTDNATGIFAQSVGGGGGNGGNSVAVGVGIAAAIGGKGGSGGKGDDVRVGVNVDTNAVDPITGVIATAGDTAHGIQAQSIGGGGGNGGFAFAGSFSPGASASLAFGGEGGSGNIAKSASVFFGDANSRIATTGDNANGIFAQSVGGGGGNGGLAIAAAASTGVALGLSFGGKGGSGADAGAVTVGDDANPLRGLITTTGEHAYGVLAQSVGGGGGNGGLSVSVAVAAKGAGSLAFGGDGGEAGAGSTVGLVNGARIGTEGDNSHALFAQSVGGGGGSGGGAIAAGISGSAGLEFSFGGKGGAGGDGAAVTLKSSGAGISTLGEKSYGILAQSIGGGGGDGGFAVSGGISGGNDVKIGIGGDGGAASNSGIVTVNNASSITTRGDDSHGLFVQSSGGGGGSGGFSVAGGISKSGSFQAAVGGAGGGGGSGNDVHVTNTAASIQTIGDRAYGLLVQSVGGGGGDGGFAVAGGISNSTSVSLGIGGKGATGGHGGIVDLTSSTAITTNGELAHGIFAQSVGGGGGSGGFAITGSVSTQNAMSASVGGIGGAGSYAERVSVTNTGAITTGGDGTGQGSYGILAQSIGGGGGAGGFSGAFSGAFGGKNSKQKSFSLAIGGEGGSGGNSDEVDVTNSGAILTKAADSVGIYAQSIGGGGGNGGFSLTAALAASPQSYDVGVSIGGDGGAAGNGAIVKVTNNQTIQTVGDHSFGIQAQSIGGGGGNGGFSINANGGTGKETKSAGVAVGGTGGAGGDSKDVTVTNNASIATMGNDAAGIQAQSLGGGGGNGGFAITGSLAGATGKSLSIAIGGDGGSGGVAGDVNVLGSGAYTISTLGDRSYGIQAMSVGGGGGNGGFTASVALGQGGQGPGKASTSIGLSIGGDGGGGDVAGKVNVGTVADALKANIQTAGVEAVGIQAQSLGGGGGNGGFSFAGAFNFVPGDQSPNNDVAIAVGGKGGSGDNAAAVLVHHEGSIFTVGDGAHGIEAQSIGGGGGNGGGAHTLVLQVGPKPKTMSEKKANANNKAFSLGLGGNGGGASDGSTVTIDHTGDITTIGGDAHGIFAQSIGGGGGSGGDANEGFPDLYGAPVSKLYLRKYNRENKAWSGKSFDIVVGGRGGASGNADAVNIKNNGTISTWGDGSHGVFAQSIGGGGGAGGAGQLGLTGTIGVGGGAGSTGNGGAVTVTLAGAVNTYGNGANAIFAQSIGGGGGMGGNVDRGLKNYANVGIGFGWGGGGGNGGDGSTVTVNSTANLFTVGVGSNGIFAQSVGGGGGVGGDAGNDFPLLNVMSFAGSTGGTGSGGIVNVTQGGNITTLGDAADGIFAQSAGGQQVGKAVNVTLASGSILTSGLESNGIFAQSSGLGGRDNATVTIASADSVVMGGTNTGAAVRFADGVNNRLINHGTLTTMGGIGGTSIVGGAGSETVDNFGTVNGSINLGAGTNTFNNKSTGLFNTGATIALGSQSTLNNEGTLSVGGLGNIQTTTISGNVTQSGTPKWLVDVGAGGSSDTLAFTGNAQFGTSTTKLDLNTLALPSSAAYTLATAAGGLRDAKFQFNTYYGDMPIGQTFGIATTDTRVQLTMKESTGLFRWTGETGNLWVNPFVDGKSNWTTDPNGTKYVYGTPGALTDVMVAKGAGISQLGADFAVNSLHFDNANGPALHYDTIVGGNNTLTIIGRGGAGITVDAGSGNTTLAMTRIALGGSQTWKNGSTGLLNITAGSIVGGGDLTIAGSGTTRIGAAIQTGGGSLTKNDDSLLILEGPNTYSGGTFVNAGTVLGDALSLQGAFVNDATVVFDQTALGTYAGAMSGTGLLIKQGVGTLVLGGTNAYSGGTIVSAGALQGTTRSLQGDFLNLGSLIFQQSDSGVYSGSITGTGALFVRGGGRYNFTGNSLAFAGATEVAGSQLFVNGALGGIGLLMQAGSLLGGNGIVPVVTLRSGSTLAPGNSIGTLHVIGDASFESGSSYQVETEARGSADLVLMTGRLFAAGGRVDVRAGGSRYRAINRYLIGSAGGGVAAQFAGVSSDTVYLVPSLQYDANNVYLTLRRNDIDYGKDKDGNPKRVAEVLNQLVPVATGAFADTLNSVYDLTPDQALQSLKSMGGIIYQHTARNLLTTMDTFTAISMKRLSLAGGPGDDVAAMGSGMAINSVALASAGANFLGGADAGGAGAPDNAARGGWWATALGGLSKYGGNAIDSAAHGPLTGLAAGFDAALGSNVRLGVGGGEANPQVLLDDADDKTRSHLLQIGAYGRFHKAQSRLDATINFGGQSNRTTRSVTDGTFSPSASASYDGTSVASQIEYGYAQTIARGLVLEPQAGFRYSRIVLDGATESGAGVLSLIVPDRRIRSQRTLAGARLVKSFDGVNGAWTMEGRAAWAHELMPLRDLHLRFTGDTVTSGFDLAAPNQLRNSGVVGFGVAGRRTGGFRFFGSVDAEVSGPMKSLSSSVGVTRSW